MHKNVHQMLQEAYIYDVCEASDLPDPQSRGRTKEQVNAQRRLDRLNMKKSTKGSFMKGPNDSFKGKDKVIKQETVKEEIINYLMDEGFVNNEVSAEVMVEHMSDEWIESILENY